VFDIIALLANVISIILIPISIVIHFMQVFTLAGIALGVLGVIGAIIGFVMWFRKTKNTK
jgi:drug/metabolite transporter (DMT)-like permease